MADNQGLLGSQGLKTAGPLPPHVYAIADAAYRAMMDAIRSSSGSTSSRYVDRYAVCDCCVVPSAARAAALIGM